MLSQQLPAQLLALRRAPSPSWMRPWIFWGPYCLMMWHAVLQKVCPVTVPNVLLKLCTILSLSKEGAPCVCNLLPCNSHMILDSAWPAFPGSRGIFSVRAPAAAAENRRKASGSSGAATHGTDARHHC